MHAFVDEVRALGYDAIEVSHSTPQAPFDRLLAHHDVRISSIHAPAPLVRDATERANSKLNLASTDDDERRAAVEFTKKSIDYTQHVGGSAVVLHLGGIGNEMFEQERELRKLFDSGTRDGERVEELRAATIKRRSDEIGPWLEKSALTLRELVDHAAPKGIALGLENRLHYHEIPQPAEAALLLRDYANAEAGYWHDVGHAEVQWRLGLVDKRAWLDTNGKRCIGTHLHDVDGIGDHRAPGKGDVAWDYLREGIPASALRVFEIGQTQTPGDVAAAIPFLRDRGVIA
jgi:sugar phosphate isomerase/epimerase